MTQIPDASSTCSPFLLPSPTGVLGPSTDTLGLRMDANSEIREDMKNVMMLRYPITWKFKSLPLPFGIFRCSSHYLFISNIFLRSPFHDYFERKPSGRPDSMMKINQASLKILNHSNWFFFSFSLKQIFRDHVQTRKIFHVIFRLDVKVNMRIGNWFIFNVSSFQLKKQLGHCNHGKFWSVPFSTLKATFNERFSQKFFFLFSILENCFSSFYLTRGVRNVRMRIQTDLVEAIALVAKNDSSNSISSDHFCMLKVFYVFVMFVAFSGEMNYFSDRNWNI